MTLKYTMETSEHDVVSETAITRRDNFHLGPIKTSCLIVLQRDNCAYAIIYMDLDLAISS